MRILKRNLSFMLALVMMLGLMVTANAANIEDYKDADKITFVEAVDTLTALGILEGEDGEFNPTDVLTREQGAKIIAFLMLGANGANALSKNVAPFSDVPANRWSAGFIAYCDKMGIVSGYGDESFGPTDPLTGYQFAKMLLTAVGYNANDEFTGPNWEGEVADVALREGLFEGNLGADFTAGVTREEAALYAFKTLTNIMTVSYSELLGAYYSGKMLNNEVEFNNDYTLGYKLYDLNSKDTTDDFGRDSHYWAKRNSRLTGNYHDEADATYTASVKSGTLYTDLNLSQTTEATVFVDGVELDDTFQIKRGLTSLATGDTVAKGGFVAGNGVLVEAYVDEDENVTLVAINTYLAQVNAVDDGEVEVTVLYGNDDDLDAFETAAEFEEDDYVLVTIAGGEIQSMVAAETKTGKATVYSSNYVTVGDRINKAQVLKTAITASTAGDAYVVDYDSSMMAILDEYGYLLGIVVEEEADANYDYVLVKDSEGRADSLINGRAAVVEVMFLDGTTEVLPLETRKNNGDTQYRLDGQWVTIEGDGAVGLELNGWYRYTINDDDQIVLKALNENKALGDTGVAVSFTSASREISVDGSQTGKYLNSKTVYHIVEDEDSIKTYTGYKNISINEESANVLVVFDGTAVSDVYILDTDVAESNLYGYYNGTTYSNANGNYVSMYVDGQIVNYNYDSTTDGADEPSAVTSFTNGVYLITVSGGDLDTAELVLARTERARVTAVNELYFALGTGDNQVRHYYDDDVEIYDATDDGKEATIARGDYVIYLEDNGFVTYAWIVSAPDNTSADQTETTGYTVSTSDKGVSSVKVTVTGVDSESETVRIVAFNYNNGINAELNTVTGAAGEAAVTYPAPAAGQITLNVYVNNTLVGTVGPLSFTEAATR